MGRHLSNSHDLFHFHRFAAAPMGRHVFRSPSSRAAFHGADRSPVAKKLASVCKSGRQVYSAAIRPMFPVTGSAVQSLSLQPKRAGRGFEGIGSRDDEGWSRLVAGHEVGTIDPVGWSCATTSAEK